MKDINESISQFIKHFKDHLEAIRNMDCSAYSTQYRKLLYVAILDALARAVYPRRGNRERLVAFLTRFSEWKDFRKISLPHLDHLLSKTPDPEFSKLRRYVKDQMAKWPQGETGSPANDPDIKEVKKYWPSDKELKYPLEGVQLESLQHVNLFVTYRNFLVHEFREPGHGYEFPADEPFYFGKLRGEINQASPPIRLLTYPVGFFDSITVKCLENLEKYLFENEVDPYLSFTFGEYWIEELNK